MGPVERMVSQQCTDGKKNDGDLKQQRAELRGEFF